MNLSLSLPTQRLLKKQMKRGGYSRPEDAIFAGLVSLGQQMHEGDFAPGELKKLLAVGEADIEHGHTIDGEKSFRARKRRRAQRTSTKMN
jgi:hypothetical protein